MAWIKSLLLAVIVAEAVFAQNRGHELFKDIEYTQAVLNTPTPVNIRKGTIEWPDPQTYEDTYGDNQMVWWYIPVPTGWKLDIYIDFHFIEETYDRFTIWPVLNENCASFGCNVTTDARGTGHHHNFVQYPSEFLYELNSSAIVEFDSDVSRGYKGFKMTWFTYPKNATFRYGRSKRLCCTSIQPDQLWNYYCLHFTEQAEEYCDCNTYYKEFIKSNDVQTQFYVKLYDYGLPTRYISNPINITVQSESGFSQRFSLSEDEQTLRLSASFSVSAGCPWSAIFGIEWFEIPVGQVNLYSNEQQVTQAFILNHQRWSVGMSTPDPDGTTTMFPTFLPYVSHPPPVIINLTAHTGNITSPNYPNRYPALHITRWNFPDIDGAYLLFFIRDFNLEENYDVLKVQSNQQDIAFNFTGILNNKLFRMDKSDATFTFISDYTIERTGFFINYTIVTNPSKTTRQPIPVTSVRPATPSSPTPKKTSPQRLSTPTRHSSIPTRHPTTIPTSQPTTPPTPLPTTASTTRPTPIKARTTTTKTTTSTLTTINTFLPQATAGASKNEPKKSSVAAIVVPVVIVALLIACGVIGGVYWYKKSKMDEAGRDSNYAVFTNDLYSSNRSMNRPPGSGPASVDNSAYGYHQSKDGEPISVRIPAAVVALGNQTEAVNNNQTPGPQVPISNPTAPSEGSQSLAEIAADKGTIDPATQPRSPTATISGSPAIDDNPYANIGIGRAVNLPSEPHIYDVPTNGLPTVQTHTTSDA